MNLEQAILLNDKYKQNNTSGIILKAMDVRKYLASLNPILYDFNDENIKFDERIARKKNNDEETFRRCRILCEMNYFKIK